MLESLGVVPERGKRPRRQRQFDREVAELTPGQLDRAEGHAGVWVGSTPGFVRVGSTPGFGLVAHRGFENLALLLAQ